MNLINLRARFAFNGLKIPEASRKIEVYEGLNIYLEMARVARRSHMDMTHKVVWALSFKTNLKVGMMIYVDQASSYGETANWEVLN